MCSEYPPKRCLVATWLVPRETNAVSAHVLCTPFNHEPVYSVTLLSYARWMLPKAFVVVLICDIFWALIDSLVCWFYFTSLYVLPLTVSHLSVFWLEKKKLYFFFCPYRLGLFFLSHTVLPLLGFLRHICLQYCSEWSLRAMNLYPGFCLFSSVWGKPPSEHWACIQLMDTRHIAAAATVCCKRTNCLWLLFLKEEEKEEEGKTKQEWMLAL